MPRSDELAAIETYQPATKDILLIVHDQLEHVKLVIDTITKHTENYDLLVWDNASQPDTAKYLRDHKQITCCHRSEENIGFIKPNNRLAESSDAEFLILINSDCQVFAGWDAALIGWLQSHPNCDLVGYQGGKLNADFEGVSTAYGSDIDYVCGWCCCYRRSAYERFGLFDEVNLEFAECEDADLSLRLRAAGRGIHALCLDNVIHFGAKTFQQVQNERDLHRTYRKNHVWLRQHWGQPAG